MFHVFHIGIVVIAAQLFLVHFPNWESIECGLTGNRKWNKRWMLVSISKEKAASTEPGFGSFLPTFNQVKLEPIFFHRFLRISLKV